MQYFGLKVQRTATKYLALKSTDVLVALPLVVIFRTMQLLDNQIASSLFFKLLSQDLPNLFLCPITGLRNLCNGHSHLLYPQK